VQQFFAGEMVKEFSGFRKVAERKLTMLDNATDLKDLLSPAGNRLERLKGDRVGQHSIRINARRLQGDRVRAHLPDRSTRRNTLSSCLPLLAVVEWRVP
jgi:hypothetical protein